MFKQSWNPCSTLFFRCVCAVANTDYYSHARFLHVQLMYYESGTLGVRLVLILMFEGRNSSGRRDAIEFLKLGCLMAWFLTAGIGRSGYSQLFARAVNNQLLKLASSVIRGAGSGASSRWQPF